ncbi:MAG TPA: T9SS type A sorting domain-containing protein, partial [Patescibacteria group bacterium]|nr:T9SS type A sorting domain-containing protein [Patescibacteria group bacterium]
MKKIYAVLLLLLAANCAYAQQKKQSGYRRYMEMAHPTPILKDDPLIISPYVLAAAPISSAVFLNKNLVLPENDPLPVQNESSIAVNPKNPKNLIASAVDYRDNSSTWVYVSHDGGKSWTNINLKKALPNWPSSNDPSVYFSAEGIGYLCYGGFAPQGSEGNGVFLARTFDEGKTWQAHIPVIVHTGPITPDTSFEDKYYVQVDNSPQSPYFKDLYIPWKRVTARDSATQIVITRSSDSGATWSVPVNVSERLAGSSEDTTFGQSFPLTATGPNGEVYVVWNHGPRHGIGFSKSTDGGKTFTPQRIIHTYEPLGVAKRIPEGVRHTLKGQVRVESYPVLVCDIYSTDAKRGNLYLVWAADRVPNIYFSKSTDGGVTWSAAKIIHSDTTNDQFWPWLSVDPLTGNIAAMYRDSRDDAANILVGTYVSLSTDAGETWIDKAASDESSDLRRNPFQGGAFAGDYSGSAFYNGIVYPSWVDMRHTTSSSFTDNDAYTAVVNTRSPKPAVNFSAKTLPNQPTEIDLSWVAPTQRAFDQALLKNEFSYVLLRDGQFLKALSSNETSLRDTGLEAFKQYEYSLAVVSGTDTSIFKTTSAFAGGSKLPATPEVISLKGNNDNSVQISLKLPTLRSDNVTPLVNLSTVAVYRDGVFVKVIDVAISDTGKITNFTDQASERGWYRYSFSVRDASSPANESAITQQSIVYTGIIEESLTENFDSGKLPRYFIGGGWALTDEFALSKPFSLTESTNGKYDHRKSDTFMLFPVEIPASGIMQDGRDAVRIRFSHAAIIEVGDSAFVETSSDNGKTWAAIATYDKTKFMPWTDNILSDDDWKIEDILQLTSEQDLKPDTVFIRFRFKSNAIRNDDGWFIDDIVINPTFVSVKEDYTNSFKDSIEIFPNPAQNYITIRGNSNSFENLSFSISSSIGMEISFKNLTTFKSGNSVTIDIAHLPSGVYLLQVKDAKGFSSQQVFTVVR